MGHELLGQRIRELRNKAGWSQQTLANHAGVSRQYVTQLELGELTSVSYEMMMQVADALPISVEEYGYLFRLVKTQRQFHVYNVGIMKTGTRSMSDLFSHYRTLHEFMHTRTPKKMFGVITDYRLHGVGREHLQKLLRKRDNEYLLEMDSAMYHSAYVDILADVFPQAQFICTLRDCRSWLDAVLNWYRGRRDVMPQRELPYVGRFLGVNFLGIEDSRLSAPRRLERLVDELLRYWSEANTQVLTQLPPGRSLVVRTHELSNQLDAIAAFVGVPRETLNVAKSHENRRKRNYRIVERMDRAFMSECIQRHCAPLMEQYFPEFSITEPVSPEQSREHLAPL